MIPSLHPHLYRSETWNRSTPGCVLFPLRCVSFPANNPTDFHSSHPQGHESEHHAFSPDGKRQLAQAHLPLDRRKWQIPRARTPGRTGVRDVSVRPAPTARDRALAHMRAEATLRRRGVRCRRACPPVLRRPESRLFQRRFLRGHQMPSPSLVD